MAHTARRVLVVGATGYIGSRLVPDLLEGAARRGHLVLVASHARTGSPGATRRLGALRRHRRGRGRDAAGDVDAVFYLVHGLEHHGFTARDRPGARDRTRSASTPAGSVASSTCPAWCRRSRGRALAHITSRLEVERILLGARPRRRAARRRRHRRRLDVVRGRPPARRRSSSSSPCRRGCARRVQPIAVTDAVRVLVDAVESDADRRRRRRGPDVVATPGCCRRTPTRPGCRGSGCRPVAPTPVGLGTARASSRRPSGPSTRWWSHCATTWSAAPGRRGCRPTAGAFSASARRCGARCSASRAPRRRRCPATPTGPASGPRCWTSYLSPPPGRQPPGSRSTASAHSSRTPDGRCLRTWRSWTGRGAVHGVQISAGGRESAIGRRP